MVELHLAFLGGVQPDVILTQDGLVLLKAIHMSRTRGKRESAGGGWHKGGDPFEEERQPKKRTKKLPSGGKGAGNGKRAAIIALCCVAALAVGVSRPMRRKVK